MVEIKPPDLFLATVGTTIETSTALEGIKFQFDSGTISADSVYVYGVKTVNGTIIRRN